MATNYPGSLDNFTNPTSASPINSPSHADQHSNANDAIEAIEGELGTNPKGAKSTVKARLDDVDTAIALKAPIASPTFTGTVTIPAGSSITGMPYLATANTFTGNNTFASPITAFVGTSGSYLSTPVSAYNIIHLSQGMIFINSQTGGDYNLGTNTYYNSGWKYFESGGSTLINFGNGRFDFSTASPGTAGDAITYTNKMMIANSGTVTINGFGAAAQGLIIKGFASQTADLQQWQDSAGSVKALVGSGGNAVFNGIRSGSGSTTAAINAYTTAAQIGILVRGAVSQTADLQQWQNSAGLAISGILQDGTVSIQRTARYSFNNGATGNERANISSNSNNELIFNITDGLTEVAHFYAGVSPTNAIQFNNVTGYPTANVFVIKGAASQSGDYFQIQNSGGTVLAQLNASNQFNVNYGSVYSQGGFRGGVNNHIGFAGLSGFAYSPAYLAIGARGAANQVANLQEWQNSAGTVLNGVNAVGQIFTGSTSPILGGFAGNSTTAAAGDGTTATITTTGAHGLSIGDFITVAGVTPTGYNGTFYVTAVPTTSQISYANATTGAQTVAGTVTFAPQVSITPRSARTVGLVIKGASSQSNNLQQWQNSSGTVLASINNGGSLQLSNSGANGIGGLSAGVMWYVVSGSSGYRPLVVQAATSQTGDLTAWQNSSGTVVTKVNAAGNIGIGSGTTALSYGLDVFTGSARIWNGITGAGQTGTLYLGDGSLTKSYGSGWELYGALVTTGGYGISSNANLDAGGTTLGYGRLSVNTGATTTVGAVIRGVASQTADLQQWQNSDGTVLAAVEPNGSFYGSSITAYGILTANSSFRINNAAAGTVAAIIKAAASQTAPLQEWQDSSGTILSSISSGGVVSGKGLSITNPTNITNGATFYNSAGTIVFNVDTSLNAVNIGGGLSGIANNFGSVWGYDSSVNAGYISFQTGALGGDSLAIRRTNHVASGDYTISTLGNFRLSTASGKNFNFNNGNIGIATTAIGTNNKIIVNAYSTVDNLATVQINTNAATNKGLVVQGIVSQTADLQQWQDSAGTVYATISPYGQLSIGLSPTIYGNSRISINTVAATAVGQVIRGVVSQTANLQEWQNSSGTSMFSIQSDGSFKFSDALTGPGTIYWGGSNIGGFGGGAGLGNTWNFVPYNSSRIAVIVQGRASQTANLQEWQNSAGNVLSKVQSGGEIQSVGFISSYNSYFYSGTADAIPLRVLGATSQTGDLQQWQNSVGTVLAKIASNGNATFNSLVATYGLTTSGSVGIAGGATTFTYSDPFTGIITNNGGYSATAPLFVVKSANVLAAGDLQQWQDSAGTVLAKVMSNGSLFINSTGTANDPFTVQRGSATRFKVDPYGNVFASALTVGDTVNAISGTQTGIYATSASTIGLIIKGAASQTASLQEWHSNTGTVAAKVAQDGTISSISGGFFGTVNSPITAGNYLAVRPWAANHVPFTVKGYTAQTSDLTRWVNDAGTTLASITSNGGIQAGTYNGVIISLNYPGIVIDTSNADNTQVWLRNLSATSKSGKFVGIKARNGYADAVAGDDLVTLEGQQYISSLGYASGKILISNDNSTPSATSYPARITFHTTAIGSTTLSERMRVDNAGLVGINMTPTDAYLSVTGSSSKDAIRLYSQGGSLAFWGGGVNNNLYTSGSMYMNGGDFAENAKLIIGTGATSNSGIVIRGVVGQTASLQEWKDSAGTSLSYIKSDGSLHFTANSNAVLISGTSTSGLNRIISNGNDLSFSPYFDGLFAPANSAGRWRPANDATSDLGSSGQRWKDLYATSGTLTNNSTSKVGLIVKAIASQTANLQEWQDSSGNAQAYVRYDGYINTNSSIRIAGDNLSVYRFQGVSDGNYTMNFPGSGNIQLFSAVDDLGGGSRVLGIKNATTVPTSNPTTGGILYVNSGALFYRGIGGAITAIARSGNESSTISANTATTVDTVALSSFTTIEYTISIKQGSKVRSSKVLVHTDGTSVDSTEYGIIEMGGGITGILVTASVSSTNSILQVTITDAATTNATVKIIKTML